MIQRSGRKMPKKNIHPCPFLSVITPRVINKTRYSKPPNPMPHHIVPPSCRFPESKVLPLLAAIAKDRTPAKEAAAQPGPF
jgi:hypothetical protein